MRIEYNKILNRFEAVASFNERMILKGKGFRWDPAAKVWHTVNPIIVQDLPLGESALQEIRRGEKREELSRATDLNVSLRGPSGYEYRPYQKVGIAFGIHRKGLLIADQRGLGKTIQAIGILNNIPWRSALIISPAKLRKNWRKELDRWLVVDGEIHQTSWDGLHKIDRRYDIIIADEGHYARNMKSKRGKAFLSLECDRMIVLTGTPRNNKTIDLFPILHKIRPDLFPSWYKFAVDYCDGKQSRFGFVADGSSREEELNQLLRRECMVRRFLRDVEKEIPDLTREIIVLDSKSSGKYLDLITADSITKGINIPFSEMAKIRRETIDEKIPTILERISEQEEGEPLVVFAWHRDIIDQIADRFPEMRPVKVYGGMSDKAAQESVDAFQSGRSDLIIGNILAMGEGHTLTRANQMVVAEWSWTYRDIEQMEGRINRVTQNRKTFVEYYVLDKSIEARMLELCVEKMISEEKILS